MILCKKERKQGYHVENTVSVMPKKQNKLPEDHTTHLKIYQNEFQEENCMILCFFTVYPFLLYTCVLTDYFTPTNKSTCKNVIFLWKNTHML